MKGAIFCLTVPKSGTHLLANIMRALLGNENVYCRLITEELLADPNFTLEHKVYVGHIAYSLEVSLRIRDMEKVLLCRDPRDVAVSYCNALYSNKVTPEALSGFVTNSAVPFVEALGSIIGGGKVMHKIYPTIQQLFLEYHLKWLPVAPLVIRYEDLLVRDGDCSVAIEACQRILNAIGVERDTPGIRKALIKGSDPSISATFHKGGIGTWRSTFQEFYVKLFKAVAPNLVSLLGYEKNENWSNGGVATQFYVGLGKTNGTERADGTESSDRLENGVSLITLPHAPPLTLADSERIRAWIETELEPIRSTLTRMKALDDNVHQRISFLKHQDYDVGFFCWTDDWRHRSLNQSFWDHNEYLSFLRESPVHPEPISARNRLRDDFKRPLFEIIEPLLAQGEAIHYLDVGCFYGSETIVLANAFSVYGKLFQLTGFDPGWAGKLTPFNFQINGCGCNVRFEPFAVSSCEGVAILYGEYGHLENCRTVNRMIATENFSYPCQSTTIDSYLSRNKIHGSIVLDIDIQGGEYHALLGAQETLKKQCRVLKLKFIPHALSTSVDPKNILEAIPGRYRIYYVTEHQRYTRNEIARDAFSEYVTALWNANPDYAYLLFIFE